jgi:hypothetical protein
MNAILDGTFVQLIDGLCAANDGNNGHPQVTEAIRTQALAGLERILLDRTALDEHIRHVQKRVGTTCRHNDLLSEEQAERIVSDGINGISNSELGILLLNPIALRDLAFRIAEALPDCWLERMSVVGRQAMQREGVERKPLMLERLQKGEEP